MYEVDGTPTDCVNIAITQLYRGRPDLVVSGINKGYNLGDDVTYSGTVSGAFEGALLGVPASPCRSSGVTARTIFRHAATAAASMAEAVLERGLPASTFLNINVPSGVPAGVRLTVQGKRNHITVVNERIDPRGRAYYWIEEGENHWEPHDRSDFQAVRDGYVSVTPLQPDMTDHQAIAKVESLMAEKMPSDSSVPR